MAAAKSAKSKKAVAPSAPPPPPKPGTVARLRGWLFRPGRLIAASFLVSIAVMAPYVPWLLPDLSQLDEYQSPLSAAQITPGHSWVPRTLAERVADDNDLPERVCLLEGDLCRRIADAWGSTPWVKQVKSVKITGEPALHIDLEYRMPVAFVEVPQGLYPVDVESILLPPADFSMSDTDRLPHIRNVRSKPLTAAGIAWGDPVVAAAARLAAVLAPDQNLETYWNKYHFVAIVAPTVTSDSIRDDEMTFEIQTAGGSRIVWGKPPGADSLEPTVEQKLARLDYLSRYGALDGAKGPQRIDIRLFDGISLQPLNDIRYR